MSPWWLKPTGEAAEDGASDKKELPAKKPVEPTQSKPSTQPAPAPSDKTETPATAEERPKRRPPRASSSSRKKPEPVEAKAEAQPKAAEAEPSGPPTILDTLSEPEPLVIPEMPDKAKDDDGDDDSNDKPSRSRSRRSRGRGGSRRSQSSDSDAEPEARKSKKNDRRGGRKRKSEPTESYGSVEASMPELSYGLGSRLDARSDEARIALFCDLENIALGVRDSDIKKFDIRLVLERLLEKGRIIVKKAYSDWERYSEYKRPFHEAAIELIDIPQKHYSGKNSADIKMVVDAMDLCYAKEHLDTFVILSGDSDFSPLVSKLREANKQVIGVGVKNSSSQLLISNCDEFIYYEDVWRDSQKAPSVASGDGKNADAFKLMADAIKALKRENKDVLWGSMVKQTMQRKQPSFSEGYHGYSTFSELLEDAQKNGLVELERDRRSGSYIVLGFGK